MRTFVWKINQFGLKVAIDDLFVGLLKRWLNAKRITVYYWKSNHKNIFALKK